jgi:hypothetical protein
MRTWTAPFLGLLAGLVMAGCAAAARESPPVFGEPSVGFDQAAEGGFAGGESFAPGEPGVAEAPVLVSNVAAVERVVIQTASLTLVVPDPAASADEIADLATEMGGFVVSSNISRTTFADIGVTADQGSIQIRVPAERLQDALERIKSGDRGARREHLRPGRRRNHRPAVQPAQSGGGGGAAAGDHGLRHGHRGRAAGIRTLRQVRQEIEITTGASVPVGIGQPVQHQRGRIRMPPLSRCRSAGGAGGNCRGLHRLDPGAALPARPPSGPASACCR